MVEVQVHVENAVGWTRSTVPDGLHYWNRSQIVPGHGNTEHATPLGPLYGPGVSEGGSGKGAHGLPTKSVPLPPPAPPFQLFVSTRQALFRAQEPDLQAPTV